MPTDQYEYNLNIERISDRLLNSTVINNVSMSCDEAGTAVEIFSAQTIMLKICLNVGIILYFFLLLLCEHIGRSEVTSPFKTT